jgi:hypothetical protein
VTHYPVGSSGLDNGFFSPDHGQSRMESTCFGCSCLEVFPAPNTRVFQLGQPG